MAGLGQYWIDRVWYGRSTAWLLLIPLTCLFAVAAWLRRTLYRAGIFRSWSAGVPVIVVGNITVGGTGKTPVTIALARALSERGYRPGVASRGYRGNVGASPVIVDADSDPNVVGDEAVLIARRCACPVAVHPDRVAAAKRLIEEGVDVVVTDDGLQHYRLQRDVEIAVLDGARGLGNGILLPSGPLREPASRLRDVDVLLVNGRGDAALPAGKFTSFALEPRNAMKFDGTARPLESFAGVAVHAVAAIGHPQRFFEMLRSHGLEVRGHALPDHALISESDLDFGDSLEIFMTEKDAVKCGALTSPRLWYVPVDLAAEDPSWVDDVIARIGSPNMQPDVSLD